MYLVFFRTNDVFLAEEKLNNNSISVEIVPTPVQDKAYCGVCVETKEKDHKKIENILLNMEYKQF